MKTREREKEREEEECKSVLRRERLAQVDTGGTECLCSGSSSQPHPHPHRRRCRVNGHTELNRTEGKGRRESVTVSEVSAVKQQW